MKNNVFISLLVRALLNFIYSSVTGTQALSSHQPQKISSRVWIPGIYRAFFFVSIYVGIRRGELLLCVQSGDKFLQIRKIIFKNVDYYGEISDSTNLQFIDTVKSRTLLVRKHPVVVYQSDKRRVYSAQQPSTEILQFNDETLMK